MAAYTVLAGADFGAGLWTLLTACRRPAAAAPGARPGQARDGAGVGGKSRLADLRARGVLDGVPGRVRLDHLDPRRAAADRRDRDHLPWGGVRAARGRGLLARRRRRTCFGGLLGAHPVRARHGGRGDRRRPGAGGERGGQPGDLVALARAGAGRGARRGVLRVPGGGVPRRRLGAVRRRTRWRRASGGGRCSRASLSGGLALAGLLVMRGSGLDLTTGPRSRLSACPGPPGWPRSPCAGRPGSGSPG